MRFIQMKDGRRIKIRAILATDAKGVIGYDGNLIFHNQKDLLYFKNTTKKKICIMGRKTFEGIGKVLPERQTIVMTRDAEKTSETITKMLEKHPLDNDTPYPLICTKIKDLPSLIPYDGIHTPVLYVCGGAAIYELFKQYIDLWMVTRYDIDVRKSRNYLPPDFQESKVEKIDMRYLHNFSWHIMGHDTFEGIPMVYRNYQVYYPAM